MNVPVASLLLVPKSVAYEAARGSQCSVHGSLTLKLLRNQVAAHAIPLLQLWKGVMPDSSILKQCIPLLWPGRAQQLLPEQAKGLDECTEQECERELTSSQRSFTGSEPNSHEIGITFGLYNSHRRILVSHQKAGSPSSTKPTFMRGCLSTVDHSTGIILQQRRVGPHAASHGRISPLRMDWARMSAWPWCRTSICSITHTLARAYVARIIRFQGPADCLEV